MKANTVIKVPRVYNIRPWASLLMYDHVCLRTPLQLQQSWRKCVWSVCHSLLSVLLRSLLD